MDRITIIISAVVWIANLLIVKGGARSNPRLLMHSFLCTKHSKQHEKHIDRLEGKDLTTLSFTTISALLLYYTWAMNFYLTVGGILGSGIFYIAFQKVMIQHRIKWRSRGLSSVRLSTWLQRWGRHSEGSFSLLFLNVRQVV